MTDSVNVNIVNARPPKSVAVAFILAFFFGPLGMLYVTVSGALIMLVVNVIVIPLLMVLTVGFGALLFVPSWIVCIIWAVIAAKGRDKQIIQMVKSGNIKDAGRAVVDAVEKD